MDWQPSEMQDAIKELAGKILTTSEDPWADLQEAGLLELDDLLDITTLLIAVGRGGGRVPALPSLVLGAPLWRSDHAPEIGTVVTAGLLEAGTTDPRQARTRVDNGKLTGQKVCVPAIDLAEWIVVPTADGVWAVRTAECQVERQSGTDDDTLGVVTFEATPAIKLGGVEVFDWWLPWVDVGVSALLLGLSQKALRLTAKYVCDRHQFGRPIGSFQAVQHRSADAWIDTQVMDVCLWQAAWRVSEGRPSDRERAIARYWASEGAHKVTAAAQHLHGGFGFDRDYELHRYFLCVKGWEFLLGGANTQLERLGGILAQG